MKRRYRSSAPLLLTIMSATLLMTRVANAEIDSNKLIEIETRKGVTLKFIQIKPKDPVAAVILLDGYGSYQMGSLFGMPTIGDGKNGVLVRTRKHFANHGLMVAVVDKPSDQKPSKHPWYGIDPPFRLSKEHAQDIRAVYAYMKKEAGIPVWLVGMCMGAISAANGGVEIGEGIDGVVFLSSVTRPPESSRLQKSIPNGIIDMRLNLIKAPVLIIANKDDECVVTPPYDAPKIKKALVNSPFVEVKYFEGGNAPVSGPCQARSRHGFYGIERKVVSGIADFIKSHSK